MDKPLEIISHYDLMQKLDELIEQNVFQQLFQ